MVSGGADCLSWRELSTISSNGRRAAVVVSQSIPGNPFLSHITYLKLIAKIIRGSRDRNKEIAYRGHAVHDESFDRPGRKAECRINAGACHKIQASNIYLFFNSRAFFKPSTDDNRHRKTQTGSGAFKSIPRNLSK